MTIKTIFKGIRLPHKIHDWILKKMSKSGRDFSKEVIYQFYRLMDREK